MLVHLITAALVVGSVSVQGELPTVSITRSGEGDVLSVSSLGVSCNQSCNVTQHTYLVEDRRCVDNTELHNTIVDERSGVSFLRITGGESMFLNSTAQNGSECVINLAVVRGSNHLISIDHGGFSLVMEGDDIKILVNSSDLVYSRTDYTGELYNLNISCHVGLVDCVFFKVNGTTDIMRGKFNGSVPPTQSTPRDFCPSSSINFTSEPPMNGTAGGGCVILDDPTLCYIVLGSAGGILLLLCLVISLCCGICCLIAKKKRVTSGRLNLRALQTLEENDRYQDSAHNRSRAADTTDTGTGELGPEEDEDHTYAIVEEAQAQVEEVKLKEVRDAKFQYAAITFDTFKPTTTKRSTKPVLYQSQPLSDEQQHEQRLPSFDRNFNPTSNRAMLARSYEIVTPMPAAGSAGSGTKLPPTSTGDLQQEEYDKLVHQERKMTGVSQRNFSITRVHNTAATNYSQLEMKSKTALANGEAAELGVKKIKPVIKKRTLIKDTQKPPNKIPSYSLVQKPKAPPLPPRDPDFLEEEMEAQKEVALGQLEEEEQHYKVPRSVQRSLTRVAWSCENIQSQDQFQPHTLAGYELYDTPTSYPRRHAVSSQRSLVQEEPFYTNSIAEVLLNSASVGSYIDMTGSQVSYI